MVAVGICAAVERARWGVWDQVITMAPRGYATAVQKAGGIALILPPDARAEAAEPILEHIDALLLAGGADVDPATYGAEAHAETGNTRPERDAFEVALTQLALERGMPVLGVCRGMHVLNVALGGTLIQHLPDVVGHERAPPHARLLRRPRGAAAARLACRPCDRRRADRGQVPPPSGPRPPRRGRGGDGLGGARRGRRGDRAGGPALRARRPLAPGGGRAEPGHRLARRGRGRAGGGARS